MPEMAENQRNVYLFLKMLFESGLIIISKSNKNMLILLKMSRRATSNDEMVGKIWNLF